MKNTNATELRKDNANYRAELILKGRHMGKRVPDNYFLPSINRMISAGEEAKAIRAIREAFNRNPEQEFKQSFEAWFPKTAKDILRGEIWPMIHDRINCRVFVGTKD